MGVGVDSPKVKFRMNQYDAFFDALIDSPETNSKLDNYNDDSKFELNFLERLVLSLREGKMTRKEVYDECLDFLVAGTFDINQKATKLLHTLLHF